MKARLLKSQRASDGSIKTAFSPRILNRVDDTILFKPLTVHEVKGIIDKLLLQLEKRLSDRHISLMLTEEAKIILRPPGLIRYTERAL